MRILREPLPRDELRQDAKGQFHDFVKAVVDVQRHIMVIGGELHADAEALLLEDGSQQRDLWGINLYPDKTTDDWIEFDSMINLRPSQGNRSRGVDNPETQKTIREVVSQLVSP